MTGTRLGIGGYKMRFKELTNNDSEIRLMSKKLNNGDFDYWLVIEVLYMENMVNNPDFNYMVTLQAVSPDEAGEEQLKSALESYGWEDRLNDLTTLEKVGILSESGCYAQLWNDGGNNLKTLLKEAHNQADASGIMFGFMMDRPINAIGSTGWDFIKGDILAGLNAN